MISNPLYSPKVTSGSTVHVNTNTAFSSSASLTSKVGRATKSMLCSLIPSDNASLATSSLAISYNAFEESCFLTKASGICP